MLTGGVSSDTYFSLTISVRLRMPTCLLLLLIPLVSVAIEAVNRQRFGSARFESVQTESFKKKFETSTEP